MAALSHWSTTVWRHYGPSAEHKKLLDHHQVWFCSPWTSAQHLQHSFLHLNKGGWNQQQIKDSSLPSFSASSAAPSASVIFQRSKPGCFDLKATYVMSPCISSAYICCTCCIILVTLQSFWSSTTSIKGREDAGTATPHGWWWRF